MYTLKALCDSAKPWQYGYPDPAAPIIRGIIHLHNNIIFYLIIILCLVCWLLFRAIFKFRTEKNKFSYKNFSNTTFLGPKWMFAFVFSLGFFALSSGLVFENSMACCDSDGIPLETTSNSSSDGDPTPHKGVEKAKLRSQAMKDFFLYAETIGLIEELKSLISLIESGQYTEEDVRQLSKVLKRLKYLNVLQPETLKNLQDSLNLIEDIEETKKKDS